MAKIRNASPAENVAAIGLGCLLALLLIGAVLTLSTLIIFFGWNLGVVAIVAACGGHAAKIGFFTALFAGLAISVIRGIFSANVTTSK